MKHAKPSRPCSRAVLHATRSTAPCGHLKRGCHNGPYGNSQGWVRLARSPPPIPFPLPTRPSWKPPRSAEHTSELHSLMRISYAVFCLKTKIENTTYMTQHT